MFTMSFRARNHFEKTDSSWSANDFATTIDDGEWLNSLISTLIPYSNSKLHSIARRFGLLSSRWGRSRTLFGLASDPVSNVRLFSFLGASALGYGPSVFADASQCCRSELVRTIRQSTFLTASSGKQRF